MSLTKFRVDQVLGIDPGPLTDHSAPLENRYYGAHIRGVVGDSGNEVEDFMYGIAPDDPGVNANAVRAAVAAWVAEGNEFPVYVPPSDEELREQMPTLTARQFRLGLLNSGTASAEVQAHLNAIADPFEAAAAEIEWKHAAEFRRDHPLVETIGAALGFTPEVIDDLWGYFRTI